MLAHMDNNQQQPAPIQPSPSPSNFNVSAMRINGAPYVVLQIATTYGAFVFFLDGDAPEIIGKAMIAASLQGRSGLIVPPIAHGPN